MSSPPPPTTPPAAPAPSPSGGGAVREVEMKLHLDPRDLDRIVALPALLARAEGEPATRALRTVYYDTPDHRLFAAGVALRVREEYGLFVQTLKTVNAATPGDAAAVAVRKEWEWTIAGPTPDFARLDAEGVAALIPDSARPALAPVFTTDFQRVSLLVRGDSLTTIEVAVDSGEITAANARARISEVELELRGGRVGRLFDLALELQRGVPLRIGTENKAEIGYRLLTGRLPAPALAEPLGLSPVTTAAEAFRHIVRHCLRHLLANEACALADGDVEGLHQMRVALRRLRTILRLYRPLTGKPDPCREGDGIAWFLRQLGPARDWDVLLNGVIEPFGASGKALADLDALAGAARSERRGPVAKAVEAIGSPKTTRVILALGAWLEDGAWYANAEPAARATLDRPVSALSGGWLAARHAKALKSAKDGVPAEGKAREKLRRRLRKLRYTVEFFRGLYAATATQPFVAALDAVLSELDAEHDAMVAGDLLRRLTEEQGDRPPGIDACLKWLGRREEKRRKALPTLWTAFREVPVFW